MSDAHDHSPSLTRPVLGGGLLVGAAGVILGLAASFTSWSDPETGGWFSAYIAKIWAGVLVGGGAASFIGLVLAWHGGMIGAGDARSSAAPIWGVLTGALIGWSLAPVLGGVLGLAVGHAADGAMLGVYWGGVWGVVSWEAGYFLADSARQSASHA